jgi:hypothetical protein
LNEVLLGPSAEEPAAGGGGGGGRVTRSSRSSSSNGNGKAKASAAAAAEEEEGQGEGEGQLAVRPNSCQHTFHLACLKAWVRVANACPNCKALIQVGLVGDLVGW